MSLLTLILRSSPLTDWFSDTQRVQGMLDFEAALVQAQTVYGVVPPEAIGPIVAVRHHEATDFAALGEAAMGAGNLAIPLVKQLTARVKARDPEAIRYVYWGAISQDAIDIGLVLQLREVLDAVETLLKQLVTTLALQAGRYRNTVMPGRTWMQHALPMTFGLRLAGTLNALLRWQRRLREMRPRLLMLQLGGTAGTLDMLKEERPAVGQALAQNLGLSLPDTPWHSQRDRLSEAGAWFTGVCDTLGKSVDSFSLLVQTEVTKVGEPVTEGRDGSSTMPHKHNPVACTAILTAAQRTPGLMATLYTSQFQQHGRALGSQQAEWEVLPNLIVLVGEALARGGALVHDTQVFPQKMRVDLDIIHGLIMAKAVTPALAKFIDKAEAHHYIEVLYRQALNRHSPLVDLLTADPQISQYLSRERLTTLLDPATTTGSAERFMRQVLACYQEQRNES